MELEPDWGDRCAAAQGNSQRAYPTFALAMLLFEEANWRAFSPEGALRYWQLIEIHQPPAQPLNFCPLSLDERMMHYLQGHNELDDRLAPFLFPLDITPEGAAIAPSQQAIATHIERQLHHSNLTRPPVIQLLGSDPMSQQLVAWQVTQHLGMHLYRLPVELLPTSASELETLARLWQRESRLLPIALYIDAHEADLKADVLLALSRFLARSNGLFLTGCRERQARLGRPSLAFEVAKPTTAEQRAAWLDQLEPVGLTAGEGDRRDAASERSRMAAIAEQLAEQFSLNLAEIAEITQRGAIESREGSPLALDKGGMEVSDETDSLVEMGLGGDLFGELDSPWWSACVRQTRPRLEALAQRLEAKATWADIVLPPKARHLLQSMVHQVRERHQVYESWGFHRRMNRGMGISALFAGDSGTGKTMAAEVIANALQLDLYRIDLSAVVSKYIGETEKNLRRLFDAAEDGGAVLFFDEADALFGKRSEVRDAHDRYANIEVSYLLQRMEAYRGVAILATNRKGDLDPAFLRRLRFIVNFPFPSQHQRQDIWQKALPPKTPRDELDYSRLAQFNLTGGNIHNIALNAAFQAAGERVPVSIALLLGAIRTELEKLEAPINPLEFAELNGKGRGEFRSE
jgi:DNA replication protein DnaC